MNVLVCGYYGFNNLGDELILKSITAELKARKPDINITVLSTLRKDTSLIKEVLYVNRWNPFTIINAVKLSDAVLLGGGGLFQDSTSSFSLYYYLFIVLFSKLFGKKVFVYAVNINKLSGLNKILAVFALKKSDVITVRDNLSLEILKSWGVQEPGVVLTADPVFLSEKLLKEKRKDKPEIAFVLRGIEKNDKLKNNFADLADRLSTELSAKIIIIPFHFDKDIAFANDIFKAIKSSNKILFEWKKSEDIYELYSSLDLVVCQRLHGLILAALYAVPFIAVSNDLKIKGFVDEIDETLFFSEKYFNFDKICSKSLSLYKQNKEFKEKIKRKLPVLKKRALIAPELFIQLIAK
jgi:polysaccharide pyruvyl transferase CsaB